MPLLPTREVTDAQAQRILAAFGSVSAFEQSRDEWLISEVTSREIAKYDEEQRVIREAKMAEIKNTLLQGG